MTFSSIHDDSHLYFMTAALCGWKQLFNQSAYADIVLGSLSWLRREKRMYLYAFVLMPSHIHAIVKPIDMEIDALLQNFGSFTAHAILQQLRKEKRDELLQFFHEQNIDRRHQHRIWQDIRRRIFSQKISYGKNLNIFITIQ